MEKRLLVTISDEPDYFYGLRFVNQFFFRKDLLRITLFCSVPTPPGNASGAEGPTVAQLAREQAEALDEEARLALQEAKRLLLWSGFEKVRVEDEIISHCFSRMEDISREMDTGRYDAAVMGRRGLSRIEDTLERDPGRKFVEQAPDYPLWICRKPDITRKNVLLCVDGKDCSKGVVDHVGAVMAGEENHFITLCRIIETFERSREETEEIFDWCKARLMDKGIDATRIHRMMYPSEYPAQAILDIAEWSRYAVVAVGPSAPKGVLERVFFGTVPNSLFYGLEGAVLWMVP